MRMLRGSLGLVLAFGVAAAGMPARASFHLWNTSEVFSSADGSVQFIEMSTTFDGQDQLGAHQLTTSVDGHQFVFPDNLPSFFTGGHTFLLATPAFAALPGAVTPDYTIPAGFFSTQGDTITLVNATSFSFAARQLPTDGTLSLLANSSTSPNSPRNFAGQTGSISAAPPHPWHNAALPLDVDNDGQIVPLDALIVINDLDAHGARALPVPPSVDGPPPFLDTDADDFVAPIDALLVINELDSPGLGPLPAGLTPDALAAAMSVPEPSSASLVLAAAVAASAWAMARPVARFCRCRPPHHRRTRPRRLIRPTLRRLKDAARPEAVWG